MVINSKCCLQSNVIGFSEFNISSDNGVIMVYENDNYCVFESENIDVIQLHVENISSWEVLYLNYNPKLFVLCAYNYQKIWSPEVIKHLWAISTLKKNIAIQAGDCNKSSVIRRLNILLEMSKIKSSIFYTSIPKIHEFQGAQA